VSWNIVFERPCGLDGKVPNDATPAMLTAGPMGSVGGASRSEWVNCARVSLTVRDPIVSVLPNARAWSLLSEAGRGRWCVEAAGPARVLRSDVVEAVADAQLVAPIERMIDLAEDVQAVDRLVEEAGRHDRAGITDRGQPRIDDGDVGVGDRGQARLIEQSLLGVREIERAALRDGAAHARPKLLLRHRQRAPRQRVGRVERIVAERAIGRAAHFVGAAASQHVDIAAQRAAELGLAA